LKDAFIKKVTPLPSCLADSTQGIAQFSAQLPDSAMAATEGYRRVRRSAAMIGLAISMGTTGLLLSSHNKAAFAANAVAADANSNTTSLPVKTQADRESSALNPNHPSPVTADSQLIVPAIKHEVKPGESLWQLSQEYRVSPQAIAASNQLKPQANLVVGQTLKIPSLPDTPRPVSLKTLSDKTSQLEKQPPQELQSSLNNLRETRKRLQQSLALLKAENANTPPLAAAKSIDVTDASQAAQVTALSSPVTGDRSIDIPVASPSRGAQLNRPMPIAVPTPETDATARIDSSEPAPILLPSPQAKASLTPQPIPSASSGASILQRDPVSAPQSSRQDRTDSDRRLSLPAALPNTAAVPNYNQRDFGSLAPAPSEATSEPLAPIPSSLDSTQPSSQPVHQVQVGDTLNNIARRYGVSVSALIKANNLTNPNLIKINQPLVIPVAKTAQKPRSMPSVLSSVPLADSRIATSQPRLPMPQVVASEIPTSVPARTSNFDRQSQSFSESSQQTKAVEIPVEAAETFHAQKLKAEVERLQQTYPQQATPIPITVQASNPGISAPVADPTEDLNPEWDSTRRQANRRTQWEDQAEGADTSVSPRSQVSPKPYARSQVQPQLVGAAPIAVEQYNDMMRLPVGETVSPELPPLSPPDRYLPDTPLYFNGYIWPAKGVLTSGYGRRWGRMHKGIDIGAPIGTPVVAAAAGQVISAGWNSGGYGNLVKVQHADGSITYYAHNSRLLVRTGQQVAQGEQIAEIGSTGRSTGPHLHFEVHPSGQGAVNPIAFLPR
jgi:murein DD-endopeptidase MepM/ murein hydrolase activator NlpD